MTADHTPVGHRPGRAVSYATYVRYGCRCEGCRAENAAYVRGYRERNAERVARASRILKRAERMGATWLRRNEPHVWRRLLAESERAQAELDAARKAGAA